LVDLVCSDTSGFVQTEPFAGEPTVEKDNVSGTLPAVSGGPGIRNSNIYWFKNDGKGHFTRHYVTKNDPQRRLERVTIADLNKDGLPDVIAVDNLLGDVVWYENPGPAALARGQLWKKHFIAKGTMLGALDVAVADFDGDGYPDVAAAGWRLTNGWKWFKNPGRADAEEWKGYMIDGGFPGASSVAAGDINRDGRPDLFVTSRDSRAILWYECPKDPTTQPWRRNVVDLTPGGEREPVNEKLVDLNGDGRLDAVVAWGGYGAKTTHGKLWGSVVWYEQAGVADGRIQWKKHIITNELPGACDVALGDLSGRGRIDVAAVGWMPGEVAWFENPGNPAGRWIKHSLKGNMPNVSQVVIANLGNEGRNDIAAIGDYGSMELLWWQNDGKR